jgi:hypothetical protein
MMIAKVTNLDNDYDYDVKNIVCVNYVDTKIILVTKLGQTLTYDNVDNVITILTQVDEEED